jgi:hypothetical protein
VQTPNKFAALDSDILLALAAGDEECQGAIDGLSRLGFYFIVTETVLQELADIVQKDQDTDKTHCAKTALGQITNWGFLTPPLDAIKMGVAERVAHDLVNKLMDEGSLNNGLVLAEAAYNGCKLFLTRSKIILVANRDSIQFSLMSADLTPVLVGSPAVMVAVIKIIESASQ